VRKTGLPAPDRAEGPVQASFGQRCPDDLRVQYEDGQASLLLGVRHQGLLCTALSSRRLQRERPLPGRGHGAKHVGEALRRQELGAGQAGLDLEYALACLMVSTLKETP